MVLLCNEIVNLIGESKHVQALLQRLRRVIDVLSYIARVDQVLLLCCKIVCTALIRLHKVKNIIAKISTFFSSLIKSRHRSHELLVVVRADIFDVCIALG